MRCGTSQAFLNLSLATASPHPTPRPWHPSRSPLPSVHPGRATSWGRVGGCWGARGPLAGRAWWRLRFLLLLCCEAGRETRPGSFMLIRRRNKARRAAAPPGARRAEGRGWRACLSRVPPRAGLPAFRRAQRPPPLARLRPPKTAWPVQLPRCLGPDGASPYSPAGVGGCQTPGGAGTSRRSCASPGEPQSPPLWPCATPGATPRVLGGNLAASPAGAPGKVELFPPSPPEATSQLGPGERARSRGSWAPGEQDPPARRAAP